MTREKIIESLLKYSEENDVMLLTKIIAYAAHDTGEDETSDEWEPMSPPPISDPKKVKKLTLSLIRDLLNTRRLMAGKLGDGGIRIVPWKIPVGKVITQVDHDWTALGVEPGLQHDIVWLGPCRPEDWPHE